MIICEVGSFNALSLKEYFESAPKRWQGDEQSFEALGLEKDSPKPFEVCALNKFGSALFVTRPHVERATKAGKNFDVGQLSS